jgi:hypothetical protein
MSETGDRDSKIVKRAANMTVAEKETLIELALKYRATVECKRTDTVTAREKESIWKTIAEEFNATAGVPRTHQQLKQVSYDVVTVN